MKATFTESIPQQHLNLEDDSRSVVAPRGLREALEKLPGIVKDKFLGVHPFASHMIRNQVVADLVISAIECVLAYPPECRQQIHVEMDRNIRDNMYVFSIQVFAHGYKHVRQEHSDGRQSVTMVATRLHGDEKPSLASETPKKPAVKRRMIVRKPPE